MSQTIKDLDDWDSNYTLLLGQPIVVQLARFENALNGWVELSDKELQSVEFVRDLVKLVIAIEHALKLELGVFSLTEFQNITLKSEQYADEYFGE
jgi:hypothetical protein